MTIKSLFSSLLTHSSHVSFSALHEPEKQRGNIFFALFGAVAIVGVIGASTMSIMRGPVSTMVQVNNKTQAESQMQIASKMAVIEAVENADGEDCDGDGAIEPIPARSGTVVPANGGLLPNSFGVSKSDPWDTEYGYCVWDAGTITGDSACASGGDEEDLLAGSGTAKEDYPVIAIISAGPDRVFDTTCNTFADADDDSNGDINGSEKLAAKTSGSDDIIMETTYAEASATAGGLWTIKAGDSDVAEIEKDLEVSGGARFTSANTESVFDLQNLAGSLRLPDESVTNGAGSCNSANIGILRRDTTKTPPVVEICYDNGGAYEWASVSSGATDIRRIVDQDTVVAVDDASGVITFDINGSAVASMNGTTFDAGALDITTTGALTAGNITGNDISGANADFSGTLSADGDTTFGGALSVDGNTTLGNEAADTVTVTGLLTANENVDFDKDLNVDGTATLADLDLTGALGLDNDVAVEWGEGTVNITGNSTDNDLDLTAAQTNVSGDLDVGGDLDADNGTMSSLTLDGTGTALNVTNDIDVGGEVEADDYSYQGTSFIPPSCGSGEKLDFEAGAWKCEGYDDDTGDGDGVGGGAFVDLADTPGAYATSAGDANKVVRVNASGNGLEFVDADNAFVDVDVAIDDLTDALHDEVANNLFLGHEGVSLDENASAAQNLAVGSTALISLTSGQDNVGIGHNVVPNLTTGSSNVAIGTDVGSETGTGGSVAIGHLTNLGRGANVFIGEAAGRRGTGGSNIGIGRYALGDMGEIAHHNTAVGHEAMREINTHSGSNTALGSQAGRGASDANRVSNNTFIGAKAGINIYDGDQNAFLGYEAGSTTTGGNNNISIGNQTALSAPDVNNEINIGNTLFGRIDDADTDAPAIETQIGIGVDNASTIDSSALLDLSSTIKGFLPPRMTETQRNEINDPDAPATGLMVYNTDSNTVDFYNGTDWSSLASSDDLSGVLAIDDLTDAYHDTTTDFDGDTNDNDDNLALGHEFATLTATAEADRGARNLAIGATALNAVTEGDDNTAFGHNAASSMQTGIRNLAIGSNALSSSQSNNANIALGYNTLSQMTSGGSNVAIGGSVMEASPSVSLSVGIGDAVLRRASGSGNVGIGFFSMINKTTGDGNVAIGSRSMQGHNEGRGNVAIGNHVMIGSKLGDNNIALGDAALSRVEGNGNVALGSGAGKNLQTGDNNILIGREINASADTASNELNIGDIFFGSGVGTTAGSKVGAVEYCDETLTNCFKAGDISGGGASDRIQDAENDTYIDVDTSDDGTANSMSFVTNSSEAMTIDQNKLIIKSETDNLGALRIQSSQNAENGIGIVLGTNNNALQAGIAAYRASGNTADSSLRFITRNSGTYAERMRIHENGYLGVGETAPKTRLDVAGSLKLGDGGEACSGGETDFPGAVRYNASTDEIEYCRNNGASTNDEWISLASTDNTSLWTNNTTYISREGDVAVTGTYDGNNDNSAVTGAGTRMFFDTGQAAFRAGRVTGTQWDAPGRYSFATGYNTQASGVNSFAINSGSVASGPNSFAAGGGTANNSRSFAIGSPALSSGIGAIALGAGSSSGDWSISLSTSHPDFVTTQVSGNHSSAFGSDIRVVGDHSSAFGNGISVSGLQSSGFGLGAQTGGANPQVTGNSSFGIFMGDRSDVDLSDEQTLGLYGDKMLFDSVTDADTNQGCIRYNDTSNEMEFTNNCEAGSPTWTALGGGAAPTYALDDLTDVTDADGAGNILVNDGTDWNSVAASNDIAIAANGEMTIQADAIETNMLADNAVSFAKIQDVSTDILLGRGNDENGEIEEITLGSGLSLTGTTLDVTGNADTASDRIQDADNNTFIDVDRDDDGSANTIAFTTAGQQRGYFGNNGNLYLGVNVSSKVIGGGMEMNHNGHATYGAYGYSNVSQDTGGLLLGKARGSTSAPQSVQNGDRLGYFLARGYDGIEFQNPAGINFNVDGTTSSGNVPTGIVFDTGGSFSDRQSRMVITSTGNVGIGTTSPSATLDVVGDIQYTGTITDTSDRRLKTDIHKLDTDEVIAKLGQLNTYSFKMKGDEAGRAEMGVIAQELEEIFPELVHTAEDEMGTKSVNYIGLIAPMIEATKTLKSENETLKAELAQVKDRQAQMLEHLETMKKDVRGMKAYTGYGIENASYANWMMLALILTLGGYVLVIHQRKRPKDIFGK